MKEPRKAVIFFPVKSCLILCFFLLRCLISCSFFSGFAGAPENLTGVKAVAPAKSATALPLTPVETGLLAGRFPKLN